MLTSFILIILGGANRADSTEECRTTQTWNAKSGQSALSPSSARKSTFTEGRNKCADKQRQQRTAAATVTESSQLNRSKVGRIVAGRRTQFERQRKAVGKVEEQFGRQQYIMELCDDTQDCKGGAERAALSESTLSERIPIARWLNDECLVDGECKCECDEASTEFKFHTRRRLGRCSDKCEIKRCRWQLDAQSTTIKFWKCTWRRRRKWPAIGVRRVSGECAAIDSRANAVVHQEQSAAGRR